MSALSVLGMSDGTPNIEGGVNLRRLDRGDVESRMPVAGIEGIGSEKSIVICCGGSKMEEDNVWKSMATRLCKARRKSEATDNGVQ